MSMRTSNFLPVMIPSYHRPNNLKTVKYLEAAEYDMRKVYVVIDSEADDRAEYEVACANFGCQLRVFDMNEARRRFDFVHRASVSRRAAGMSRNMFYDIAETEGFEQWVVMDDDTEHFQIRPFGIYVRMAKGNEFQQVSLMVADFMEQHHIGCWGLSQTGDLFAESINLIRHKVMNVTYYHSRYIYRGERGVQDNDTSQFVGIMNEGYFTGSFATGLILKQTPSATSAGGLTDLYNECKLLNKSLVCPIQFPSAIRAEKQVKNGGRLHHRINYRYLEPKLVKDEGRRGNIRWDEYPEDGRFTNEPKRKNAIVLNDAKAKE